VLNVIGILHHIGKLRVETEYFWLTIFEGFINTKILTLWCCIGLQWESRQDNHFTL